ncbi:MAG: hypothetical protein JWM28_29 [Chitinophagaceae bacterium]|nr:hypothetical protein [Chitinophagaceae bacterium]
MKKCFLFVILISSVITNAQSLKDALYSGKLKTDTGTVIRKGDDLTSKIDTSRKKPVDSEKTRSIAPGRDSSTSGLVSPIDSAAAPGIVAKENVTPKDNNKIWKEYIDSLTSTLKTEVLPSKKIKSGTYYVLIEYEIGPDGQIAINSLSCSPESSFLEQQVKERFTLTAPQMIPLLSNGKARKVVKKYTLVLSKP